ncbi:MAG: DNA-deoxyinosine glycosylase [Candidatus Fimenecus sp.]
MVKKENQNIIHPFPPFVKSDSKILILGSFPSVKSREVKFFYGHPQNRFWNVVSAIYDYPVPKTVDEKKIFLKNNHIALWDVIYSCEIKGSSDISIKNVLPNNLDLIFNKAKIQKIYLNGKTSEKYFMKYQSEKYSHIYFETLPSTSPANAIWNLEKLISKWKIIKDIV